MKSIYNSLLLVVFSLLPFLFSSCSNDDSAPMPTVSIVTGEVTDASLTFTVTAANSTKAAWICVKKGEAVPTVENILAKGKSVDASKATVVTVSDLEHNTDYVIAVAVEGEGGTASNTANMKTAKSPDPTVALALEGEATETSFSFKVTIANATKYAYKCIKDGETVPTIASILADGINITDITKAIEVKELLPNTKYAVYVAVEGRAGQVLSAPLEVTTKQKVMNLEFTESSVKSVSGNNYYLRFANNTYELKVDFYTTSGAKYLMPGIYKLDGMKEMECAKQYTDLTKDGAESKSLFNAGDIEVAIVEGNTYEIKINLTLESGELVTGYYKGEILGMVVVEVVEDTYKFTANVAERKKPNNMIPGEYYIAMNDNNWNFEMTLEFYANPTTTELPVGTYTLNSNREANTVGTESHINVYGEKRDFTSHFDGSGTIEVTKADNKYTFKMNLTNSKGQKYIGDFTGEIKNMDLAKQ